MQENKDKAIQVDNQWYIPTTSSRADDRVRVLKSDDGFAVLSRHGEMGWAGLAEQGFYFLGTRHLSKWQLTVEGKELVLLNSTVRLDNSRLVVDQTTPDLRQDGGTSIPQGRIHLRREMATHHRALSEHLEVVNYHSRPCSFKLQYDFNADFTDIFEVRGIKREQRGNDQEPEVHGNSVVLAYVGLDKVERRTRVGFSCEPTELKTDSASFIVELAPGERFELEASVSCDTGGRSFFLPNHQQAVEAIDREMAQGEAARARVWTDNEQFNDWLNRSTHDLQLLTTETTYGLYPYAGIPWFATPFGRDGLITALQTLWWNQDVARGVLTFLAATQAEEEDPLNEAEPGKILHELREGEMAALGEVPFRRYYGTVDATPLFVVLAGRYYQASGDRDLLQSLWRNIEAAVNWVLNKQDERGFLTYERNGDQGLVHQGWKDSDDSVFHRDGLAAKLPIALCEVQGYAYEALLRGAQLAETLGHHDISDRWSERANCLRDAIEAYFWQPEIGTYALALDGDGRPCQIRASNAGHLLYNRVVQPERAKALAASLTSRAAYNGWGLRTVYAGEPRYNPMSYHNGSIWPHDTAMAAAGLANYGFKQEASKLTEGLFNAAILLDQYRLPELFCGFDRIPGQAPTLYAGACAPQAWASGAVFMLLEAMLGLSIDAINRRVCMNHPTLPYYLSWLRIQNLRCGDALVDIVVRRHGQDVAVNVENRRGDVELSVQL